MRTTLPMLIPWTRIENTTTAYVSASTTSRCGPLGKESASATEMPPRNPPQVSTCNAPRGNLNTRPNRLIGAPTDNNRCIRYGRNPWLRHGCCQRRTATGLCFFHEVAQMILAT